MGFLGMLIQVVWVGVILLAIMIAAAMMFLIALPNCIDSCGNVTITYPYGITVGCYLIDHAMLRYYFINCTTTNTYNQPHRILETLAFQLIRNYKNIGYRTDTLFQKQQLYIDILIEKNEAIKYYY